MRKLALIAALVATLVVTLAAPAAAAKPGGASAVAITNVNGLDPGPPPVRSEPGTFAAKGAAAKKGLLCAEGSSELAVKRNWLQYPPGPVVYEEVRRFDCDDGYFLIVLVVTVKDFTKASPGTMTWKVLTGGGAYEGLTGGGTGKVDPERKNQVVENYRGKVSLP